MLNVPVGENMTTKTIWFVLYSAEPKDPQILDAASMLIKMSQQKERPDDGQQSASVESSPENGKQFSYLKVGVSARNTLQKF